MESEAQNPSSSSPPQTEPLQKKLKLSTTPTSGDDPHTDPSTTTDAAASVAKTYKRRKVAIFFAYCGVGYQGMQKNPGAKTIEGDLEEALELAGAVPEQDRGHSKRWDWARSARTDKGVSAVCQVVSGRFIIDPPGFVERLNSQLPNQIRIFGYKRVTPTFNAKRFCDRRRYLYLIPVFALDPSCHQEVWGSGDEDTNCLLCSKFGGLIPKRKSNAVQEEGFELSEGVFQPEISSNREAATVEGENEPLLEEGKGLVGSEMAEDGGNSDVPVKLQDKMNGSDLCYADEEKVLKNSEFSYGEKEKERLNRILKNYVGTHNFHNFTTRTKAEDPSAKRYIVSFTANSTVTVNGMEFVKCEVLGQSFMLHQIRKMIGMAVAIMRDCASESIFDAAFQQDVRINVPTAPEVGLFLDECLFTSYNKKWNKSHEEVSMRSYFEQAEEFKKKYIYSHIAEAEQKEGVVGLWLHYINHQNYPDLHPPQSVLVVDSEAANTVAPQVHHAEVDG
ncbi:hypothetical protein V2J09_021246 [Rumex salicifolius]